MNVKDDLSVKDDLNAKDNHINCLTIYYDIS